MLKEEKDMIYKNLSQCALTDRKEFDASGEDGVCILLTKYNIHAKDVIMRFQTSKLSKQFMASLKTEKQWNYNSFGPVEVGSMIEPITVDNKFSSFALKENLNNFGFLTNTFPLTQSYATENVSNFNGEFKDFYKILYTVSKVYNIKIIEDFKYNNVITYKRTPKIIALLKSAGHKTLNLCKTVFKREISNYKVNDFEGKVNLHNKITVNGKIYTLSQQEQTVVLIDSIVGVSIKKISNNSFLQLNNNQKYAAQLLADLLVCRAINFGSKKQTANVLTALELRFSNTLAQLNLSNNELLAITTIATNCAMNIIADLGFSVKDITSNMEKIGYYYTSQPTTIKSALSPLKKSELISEMPTITTQIPANEHNLASIVQAEKEQNNLEIDKDTENAAILKKSAEMYAKMAGDGSYNNPFIMGTKQDTEPEKKYKTVKFLQGVITKKAITKKATEKYIDETILNVFKTYTLKIAEKVRLAKTTANRKKYSRYYNFIEHACAFYNNNKNEDAIYIDESLIEDNDIAHNFAVNIINSKKFILDSIFGEKDKIEQYDKLTVRSAVNDIMKNIYQKSLVEYLREQININVSQNLIEHKEDKTI